jgi:hypothetical protein
MLELGEIQTGLSKKTKRCAGAVRPDWLHLLNRPPRATRLNRRRLTQISSYVTSEKILCPTLMRFEPGLKSGNAREFKQKTLRPVDRSAAYFVCVGATGFERAGALRAAALSSFSTTSFLGRCFAGSCEPLREVAARLRVHDRPIGARAQRARTTWPIDADRLMNSPGRLPPHLTRRHVIDRYRRRPVIKPRDAIGTPLCALVSRSCLHLPIGLP